MDISKTFDQILPENLNAELWRLSGLLEEATDQLKSAARTLADTENAYRQAKALNYLTIHQTATDKPTVALIQAKVDKACADERQACYFARADKETALERIKSLRAQLSALQSVAASVRSEMEMAGKVSY